MIRISLAVSLVLGFPLFAVGQQRSGNTMMRSVYQGQTVTRGTSKLFLNNDGTAFLDANGRVVFTASEPDLQEDVRRISRTFQVFREREESAPIPIKFEEFSEGLAVIGWALCPMCRNPFWVNAFIDETGRVVIPPKTSSTRYGSFREGVAKYTDSGWGFIDRTGRIVITAKYSVLGDFSEGLAFVSPSGEQRYGYLNKQGHRVIPSRFKYASDFHEGLAIVILMNVTYAFIDRTGEVVLHSKNWQGVDRFSEGLAAVRVTVSNNRLYRGYKEPKYGFMDREGSFVIPPQFDRAERFSEGRALFGQFINGGSQSRDGINPGTFQVGFIGPTGQIAIKPEYVDGKTFSEGLAAVAVRTPDKKKVWGYVDREGRVVITPQFTNAASFSGGLAAVNCDSYSRNCQAYIDREGKVLWQAAQTGQN